MMLSNRRDGFTLIELLIVIAIVAVLTAILFPVILTARESARKTRCLYNIKSINNAALQYADDNGGKFVALNCYDADPPDGNFNYNIGRWKKPEDWRNSALYPYLKGSKEFLMCPSDIRKVRSSRTSPIFENEYCFTYTMPGWMTWVEAHDLSVYSVVDYFLRFNRARVDGVPISLFRKPSKTMSFVDEGVDPDDFRHAVINNALFISGDKVSTRHNGAGAVAYLDGHVGVANGGTTYGRFCQIFFSGWDWAQGNWDVGYRQVESQLQK
jgi:prepilin-type N-terminal cleavage/methylation domain-containing protein/prepilin-type processing-associated H-X9-DG protein